MRDPHGEGPPADDAVNGAEHKVTQRISRARVRDRAPVVPPFGPDGSAPPPQEDPPVVPAPPETHPEPPVHPDPGPDATATRRFVREPRHTGSPPPPPEAPAREDRDGMDDRGDLDGAGGPPARRGRPDTPGPRGPRRRRKWISWRWTLTIFVLILVAVPCVTWVAVWYTARQDARPPSDAIVVMGASQYNGRPSAVFEARLRHAQELYLDGVAPAVVTVGGNLPGDNYTEGGAGRDWLVEHGVPADAVVAVEEGSDSLGSLEAVAEVFNDAGWSSAVIVTDPWHSLRSQVIAEDTGMSADGSPVRSGPAVHTRETQLWYITRETASLLYYWTFGESAGLKINAA